MEAEFGGIDGLFCRLLALVIFAEQAELSADWRSTNGGSRVGDYLSSWVLDGKKWHLERRDWSVRPPHPSNKCYLSG